MGTINDRRRRRTTLGAAALALVAGVAALLGGVSAPAAAYEPGHTLFKGAVDAGDPGMGQTNGPVLTLETVNGQVVAGGNFTSTRPAGAAAGTGETRQGYLASFDERTGQPSSFLSTPLTFQDCEKCPNVESPVVRATALSPDGGTLWVGGDFNRAGDTVVNYIARFDTTTGQLLGSIGRSWPQGTGVDGPVHALSVSPDGRTLYVGGTFQRAGDNPDRRFAAAFDIATGDVTGFAPRISTTLSPKEAVRVVSVGVSGDSQNVLLGGTFTKANGRTVQGFAPVSATTGRNLQGTWAQPYLRGNRTWATVIESGGDGTIYVGARSDSRGDLKERTEGVYRLDDTTGAVRWYANCYGDTYAIQPVGPDVYVGSHAHNCGPAGGMPEQNPRIRLAVHAVNNANGKVRPYFVLTSGQTDETRLLSRAFTVDSGRTQLVMGGGYNRVNDQLQNNLVRFARGSARPSQAAVPSASTCRGCARARVAFRLGFDRDDIDLTYEVFRTVQGQKERRIRTLSRQSFFYAPRTVAFQDKGVKRGQRVRYRVRVSDPAGNRLMSGRTAVLTVGRP
ncbi:hypothetical protein [uncultured Nocardioides sp.]|uniref:YncE family protein n=1 Tax=uncultured Nocardioides sp. TaxID=198441 RepID=UPI002630C50C|nr:hypothetical protein [uncultured Nocardioides sp.]